MALVRCPICGEKYSDTYKYCPFCEEEEALERGVQIRRNSRRPGKRAAKRDMNILTPTLTILILIMAALLVYLLFGDTIAGKLGLGEPSGMQTGETLPGGNETPSGEEIEPVVPDVDTPDDPETDDPETNEPGTDEPQVSQTMDYAAAAALPGGLRLSTTDFSLRNVGENHTIAVSGGNGDYQWFSENPAIAAVDASGKVTALSGGTINVVVTDGEKQGTCIVRCRINGGSATTTTPEAPPAASALQAGAGKVVNGGNGVRVRAEANTSSEILATLTNGADVQIVEGAGGDWYKITFSGVGGVTTTGYMKGEFLANR